MNILITGNHGFVGSNLTIALKKRHNLYGLDIIAPEEEGVINTFFWKDIESTSFPMQNLPAFDAIIHLAGKAHDTKINLLHKPISTSIQVLLRKYLISFWSHQQRSLSFLVQ